MKHLLTSGETRGRGERETTTQLFPSFKMFSSSFFISFLFSSSDDDET